tara:strand:- start:3132 stop:3425 length:294 start_codon:yes stop_codon:yes gene_type:complete
MIELTEIYSAASEYDPVAGRVKTDFALRRALVNPEHVIVARANEDYNSRTTPMVDGLSEHTQFTRLFLIRSNAGPTMVDVVGPLEQIAEKLNKREAN